MPVMAAISSATFSANPTGALSPVPTAVPLGELAKAGERHLDPFDRGGDLRRIAGKLLPQRQGRCVLRVGAADLDDVIESLHLLFERLVQVLERRQQIVDHALRTGDVHGGGIGVVRRLAHIDVIVRVNRLLRTHDAAEQLDRTVGNDLVRIHVRLGSGARLPHDEREVFVKLAVDHLLCGLDDGVADRRVEAAERHVGAGSRLFDDAECAHDCQRLLFPADFEIAQRSLRLGAPIAVARHFDGAERICFRAGRCHRDTCFRHAVHEAEAGNRVQGRSYSPLPGISLPWPCCLVKGPRGLGTPTIV